MANNPEQHDGDLAARVADIEQCIGDFAEVFAAMKVALSRGPGVDCPPYCAHGMANDHKDKLSLVDRVSDIKKCIGDFGLAFETIREALDLMHGIDCPPYCAHKNDRKS
jgi:hypothetical protein